MAAVYVCVFLQSLSRSLSSRFARETIDWQRLASSTTISPATSPTRSMAFAAGRPQSPAVLASRQCRESDPPSGQWCLAFAECQDHWKTSEAKYRPIRPPICQGDDDAESSTMGLLLWMSCDVSSRPAHRSAACNRKNCSSFIQSIDLLFDASTCNSLQILSCHYWVSLLTFFSSCFFFGSWHCFTHFFF